MDIIVTKPYGKLRSLGLTKNLAGGFARFLVRYGFAMPATKSNVQLYENSKAEIEKLHLQRIADAEATGKKIAGTVVTFVQQAGEDGKLFGSITTKDLAKALVAKTSEQILHSDVDLDKPIKHIGVFRVNIKLYGGTQVEIIANVNRSDSEASDAIQAYLGSLGSQEASA